MSAAHRPAPAVQPQTPPSAKRSSLNLLALAAPVRAARANYSCAALGAAALTLARAARTV